MAGRIEDYGLIGDTRTVALVCDDGSIDWFCAPRIDSGACFAALLGGPEHGRWLIAPVGGVTSVSRRYEPETLVLETTWVTDTGTVTVRGRTNAENQLCAPSWSWQRIIWLVFCLTACTQPTVKSVPIATVTAQATHTPSLTATGWETATSIPADLPANTSTPLATFTLSPPTQPVPSSMPTRRLTSTPAVHTPVPLVRATVGSTATLSAEIAALEQEMKVGEQAVNRLGFSFPWLLVIGIVAVGGT